MPVLFVLEGGEGVLPTGGSGLLSRLATVASLFQVKNSLAKLYNLQPVSTDQYGLKGIITLLLPCSSRNELRRTLVGAKFNIGILSGKTNYKIEN
jgi:hypothetical protein